MALETQGTKLFWSATTAVSSAVEVKEVTDFTGPGGAAAVIDVSHLGSTAKEKIMGLSDEGQLSLTLNYNPTDAGQVALQTDRATRSKKKALLKFNDAATNGAVFDAFCLQFSVAGAVDGKVTANAVLEITGKVTWTTV